jgi:hypothetical protein
VADDADRVFIATDLRNRRMRGRRRWMGSESQTDPIYDGLAPVPYGG